MISNYSRYMAYWTSLFEDVGKGWEGRVGDGNQPWGIEENGSSWPHLPSTYVKVLHEIAYGAPSIVVLKGSAPNEAW